MTKHKRPEHWTALDLDALATLRNGLRASVLNADVSRRAEAQRLIAEVNRKLAHTSQTSPPGPHGGGLSS